MKSKNAKRLPIHLLMSMANAACDKYGFERILPMEAQKMYRSKILPAAIRRNSRGMLWIDPEYIALQFDDGDVIYLYMSMTHINAEVASYRAASRARSTKAALPEDISEQFSKARKLMQYTGRSFYISPSAAELGLDWVKQWLKQFFEEAMKVSDRNTTKLMQRFKEVVA